MKRFAFGAILGVLTLLVAQPAFAQPRGGSRGGGSPGRSQPSFRGGSPSKAQPSYRSGSVRPPAPRPRPRPSPGQYRPGSFGKNVQQARSAGLPRGYPRFSSRSYSSRYRCSLWRGPRGLWYYWCPRLASYLPVEYIDDYPPGDDDGGDQPPSYVR